MKRFQYLLLSFLLIFAFACNKDEEPVSQTYLNMIGLWDAKEIQYSVSINGKSILQYYLDQGASQEEAEDLTLLFGQILAAGFDGTIEFKNDNSFVRTWGGDTIIGTWALVNNDQSVQLTADSETEEYEIKSVSSTELTLTIEISEKTDFDGDGSADSIEATVDLISDKLQ